MSIALSWINLSASVGNKFIINNLTGAVDQSSLNAVMGPSGCGKTSLLNCLNASNKFDLSPDSQIFVCKSREINSAFICQNQSQKLICGLTVGQSLTYASQLKNSTVDGLNHRAIVNRVMAELLIEDIDENRIEKCSGGQLKRVCIGLELTALKKPDFLFLDEPTTGLDSTSSEVVIDCLRKVKVYHKICIICTIHQPNQELFHMFDDIYVIAKGGHQLYSGPPQQLIHYLSEVDIIVKENQIPIEVLLEYSSYGISDPNVKRMNVKSLKFTNEKFKEYSEQNMNVCQMELKTKIKSFKIRDTLTLVRRQFRITFIAEFRNFVFNFNILFFINLIMVILFDPKNGRHDGCDSLNNNYKTCLEIEDNKSYLFTGQSYLGLSIFYMIFAKIMIKVPDNIDQYTVFQNEYQNGY